MAQAQVACYLNYAAEAPAVPESIRHCISEVPAVDGASGKQVLLLFVIAHKLLFNINTIMSLLKCTEIQVFISCQRVIITEVF